MFISLITFTVLYGVGDYIAQRAMANNENGFSDKVHDWYVALYRFKHLM